MSGRKKNKNQGGLNVKASPFVPSAASSKNADKRQEKKEQKTEVVEEVKEVTSVPSVNLDEQLLAAILDKNIDLVQDLLKGNANPNTGRATGPRPASALQLAAEQGDAEIVRALIGAGACVNAQGHVCVGDEVCTPYNSSKVTVTAIDNGIYTVDLDWAIGHLGRESISPVSLTPRPLRVGDVLSTPFGAARVQEKRKSQVVLQSGWSKIYCDSEELAQTYKMRVGDQANTSYGIATIKEIRSDGLFVVDLPFGVASLESESISHIPLCVNIDTALHLAVAERHVDVVNVLLENGADIEAVDGLGRTPLLVACHGGDVDTALALLASNADIEAKDKCGDGVVALAVSSGSFALVDALLKANADARAINEDGESAVDIAQRTLLGDVEEITTLLLASGATFNKTNTKKAESEGQEGQGQEGQEGQEETKEELKETKEEIDDGDDAGVSLKTLSSSPQLTASSAPSSAPFTISTTTTDATTATATTTAPDATTINVATTGGEEEEEARRKRFQERQAYLNNLKNVGVMVGVASVLGGVGYYFFSGRNKTQ